MKLHSKVEKFVQSWLWWNLKYNQILLDALPWQVNLFIFSSQLNINSFDVVTTFIFLVNIQSQFLPFGSLPFHDNLVLCKRIPTNRRIWTWHLFHDHCARLNLFDRSKILIIPFDLFLTLKNSCSFLPLLYS